MSGPRRIVILGAESTGTTTLANALAAHHETVCVPEYGRYFWEGRQFLPDQRNTWSEQDFLHIQEEQNRLENNFAALATRAERKVLFCDTDCVATTVWGRFYLRSDAEHAQTVPAAAVTSSTLDSSSASSTETDMGPQTNARVVDSTACRQAARRFVESLPDKSTRLYFVTSPDIPYEQVRKGNVSVRNWPTRNVRKLLLLGCC